MKDYKCKYSNYTGFQEGFVESIGLKLPDMFFSAEDIAAYAIAEKERSGRNVCHVVLDTALQAEALGAKIVYDKSPLGPRTDKGTVIKPEEVLNLPPIDLSAGRIPATLKACDILREKGEKSMLEIRGMFDTLNSLCESTDILMLCMRDKKKVQEIADKIRADVVAFAELAVDHCDLLQYADSSGGLNVIGPKVGKNIVEWFTVPLMKDLEALVKAKGKKLQLCPKTSLMLQGAGYAEFVKVDAEPGASYVEVYMNAPEDIVIFGEKCNREVDDPIGDHYFYLKMI